MVKELEQKNQTIHMAVNVDLLKYEFSKEEIQEAILSSLEKDYEIKDLISEGYELPEVVFETDCEGYLYGASVVFRKINGSHKS